MKLVLVGTAAERAWLRAQMDGHATVVGEFDTLAAARLQKLDANAIVLAPAGADSLVEPLTPRELQVLELLAEGLPNKTIAARLGLSDQTVKFHVAAIAGKLGAANRTDAVRRAVRQGLITF